MNCNTSSFPVLHLLPDCAQIHGKCLLSRWCYLAVSSLANPFSFCRQSFPASGSLPLSQLFTSDGQSIGASASASALPKNIQNRFPLGLTGLISAVQGTLKSLLQHHNSKASVLHPSAFYMVQLSHPYMYICFSSSHLYMTTGKAIDLTILPLSAKWCLCFLACCLGLSLLFF